MLDMYYLKIIKLRGTRSIDGGEIGEIWHTLQLQFTDCIACHMPLFIIFSPC